MLKKHLEATSLSGQATLRDDQNIKASGLLNERIVGPVDQSGMIAAFARRRSRVRIPSGPFTFPDFLVLSCAHVFGSLEEFTRESVFLLMARYRFRLLIYAS